MPVPTIKGVFVRAHLNALARERGAQALVALRSACQVSLNFKNSDDLPVADEVALLECIVTMQEGDGLPDEERQLRAGRLHFKNFTETTLWSVISNVFGPNLKLLLMQSPLIAGRVFKGVDFAAEDIGERCVRITMGNNDYPLAHFKGFFEGWIAYAGLSGAVEASADPRGAYEYEIVWNEPHVEVSSCP